MDDLPAFDHRTDAPPPGPACGCRLCWAAGLCGPEEPDPVPPAERFTRGKAKPPRPRAATLLDVFDGGD